MTNIVVSSSIIVLSIAIILVGGIGALCQNWWLGYLGTKRYKKQPVKKKGVVPSVMFFFPLPFTTYTYVFFRALTSKDPKLNIKKISSLRRRIFKLHLKK